MGCQCCRLFGAKPQPEQASMVISCPSSPLPPLACRVVTARLQVPALAPMMLALLPMWHCSARQQPSSQPAQRWTTPCLILDGRGVQQPECLLKRPRQLVGEQAEPAASWIAA